MKTGGVVQIRLDTDSDRLVLESLNGAPVIDHVLWNISKIQNLDSVILAAPDSGHKEVIGKIARRHSLKVYFGAQERFERVAAAAQTEGMDVVVRFAANAPFLDPVLARELIDLHLAERFDYTRGKGFPAGLLPEVICKTALMEAAKSGFNGTLYNYFLENQSSCKTGSLENRHDFEAVRLDIRSPLDLVVADELMKNIVNREQGYNDIVEKLPMAIAGLIAETGDASKKKIMNSALNRLECAVRPDELLSMPAGVRIDTHNLCNIQCKTCLNGLGSLSAEEFSSSFSSFPSNNIGNIPVFFKRDDGKYIKKPLPMDSAVFNRIEESMFPFLEKISFGVYGEPLLNGDILKMLGKSKAAGLHTHLLTNGTLLSEKTVGAVSEMDVDEVTVSFDAASPELFEKIRRGANYGAIIDSIKNLQNLRLRKGNGKPHLQFYFTASRENVRELPELVNLAHHIGVDSIYVLNRYIGDFMDSSDSLYFHRPESERFLREAAAMAGKFNVDFSMSPLIRYILDGSVASNGCASPWSEPYISSVGTVHPCGCSMMGSVGRITDNFFAKIWNSGAYKNLRRGLSGRAELSAECKHCLVGGFTGEKPEIGAYISETHI